MLKRLFSRSKKPQATPMPVATSMPVTTSSMPAIKSTPTVKELQKQLVQPKTEEGQASLQLTGKAGLESVKDMVKMKNERKGEVQRTGSELKLFEKWHETEVDPEVEITTLLPRGVDPDMVQTMSRQYFLNTTVKKAEESRLPPFIPGMTGSDEDNLKLLPQETEIQARHHLTKRKTKKQLHEEQKYREEAWKAKLKEAQDAAEAKHKVSELLNKEEEKKAKEMEKKQEPKVEKPKEPVTKPEIKPAPPVKPAPEKSKPVVKPPPEKPKPIVKPPPEKPKPIVKPQLEKAKPPVKSAPEKPKPLVKPALEKPKPILKPGKEQKGGGDTIARRAEIVGKTKKILPKKKQRPPSSSSSYESTSSSSEEDLSRRYYPFGGFPGFPSYPSIAPGGFQGYRYGQQPQYPQTYQAMNANMRGFQVPNPNLFQPQQPIPKPKVDVKPNKKVCNDGLDFEFRPHSACGMDVTITIEPEEPDPIEFALDNGISPIVCCMMPPCLMVAPPNYQSPFQTNQNFQQACRANFCQNFQNSNPNNFVRKPVVETMNFSNARRRSTIESVGIGSTNYTSPVNSTEELERISATGSETAKTGTRTSGASNGSRNTTAFTPSSN